MDMRSRGGNKQNLPTPQDEFTQHEEDQYLASDDAGQNEDDEQWSDVPPETSEQRVNANSKQQRQRAGLEQRAEGRRNRRESQNPFSQSFRERPSVQHSQTHSQHRNSMPPANPGGQIFQVPPNYSKAHDFGYSNPFTKPVGPSYPQGFQADHVNDPNPPDAYPTSHYPQSTFPSSGYPYSYTPYNSYPESASPHTGYPHPYAPYDSYSYPYSAHSNPLYPNRPLPPSNQQQHTNPGPSTLERKLGRIQAALDDVRAEREAAAREKKAIRRKKEAMKREREAIERQKETIEREKEAAEREAEAKDFANMKQQMLKALRRDIELDVQAERLDLGRARGRVDDHGPGGLSQLARQVPLDLLHEKERRPDSILEEIAQFLELKGRLEGRSSAQGGSARGGSIGGSTAYGLDLAPRPSYMPAANPVSRNEIEAMVHDYLTRILMSPMNQATDVESVSPGAVPPGGRNWTAEAEEMKTKMDGYAKPSQNEKKPKPKRADSGYGSVHAEPGSGDGNAKHRGQAVRGGRSTISPDEKPRRTLRRRRPRASRYSSSQDSLRVESSSDESDDAEPFPLRTPAPYMSQEALDLPTSTKLNRSKVLRS